MGLELQESTKYTINTYFPGKIVKEENEFYLEFLDFKLLIKGVSGTATGETAALTLSGHRKVTIEPSPHNKAASA